MVSTGIPKKSQGFWNLLARENKAWWGGFRWIILSLLGIVGLNGMLAFVLFVLPVIARAQGEEIAPLEVGFNMYFGLSFLVFALSMIILAQDAIIGEKQSGVAAWILSKPVSRAAYIGSKYIANSLGALVLFIVLQNIVASVLFMLAGAELSLNFFLAIGLMTLHTFFYLTLTLLLGILSNSRGLVLGVSLGSLLGGSLMVSLAGPATLWAPWPLTNIAVGLATGADLPRIMLLPVVFTVLWCVLGVLFSIWKFNRTEL